MGLSLALEDLIRAYSKATSEGVEATGIVERKLMRVISTKVDYTWLGKLENELRSSIYQIKEIEYLDQVIHSYFCRRGEKTRIYRLDDRVNKWSSAN